MPELPDLQVFSKNLQKKLAGKTLEKIAAVNEKKLNVSTRQLRKTLEGQTLTEVYRDGKELHFAFDKGDVLALHLMLNGRLDLFTGSEEHRHTILDMRFSGDTGLVLTDYRSLATVTLNPENNEAADALSAEMNDAYLTEQLAATRTTVKNLLLNQQVIKGIGNAYADEILWDAGISPFSVCHKIPPAKIKALAKSIKSVLKQAEKQIAREAPGITSGEVRDFLKIHHPGKKESPTGYPIHQKTVSGRKTYFTDEQELFA
jgi:formamidopyrimidine-DNA glycosylase